MELCRGEGRVRGGAAGVPGGKKKLPQEDKAFEACTANWRLLSDERMGIWVSN